LDGLQRQFPQAFALAGRIPNPRAARAPLLWSVLAAFGTAFFVSAAILVALTLFARLLGLPTEWIGGIATAAATATALSVAYTAGGRGAVYTCAGVFVFEQLFSFLATTRFCSAIVSDGLFCSPFAYVLGLWPRALGVAIAYRIVHWWRVAEGVANPLFEAVGALTLTQTLVASILGTLLGLSSSPFMSGVLVLFAAAAGGAACGLTTLRRVPPERQWATLAIVAAVVFGLWLVFAMPAFVGQVGIGGKLTIGGLDLTGFASPLVEIGLAAVVLYMAAARRLSATQSV